jgi:hypothetical protein
MLGATDTSQLLVEKASTSLQRIAEADNKKHNSAKPARR